VANLPGKFTVFDTETTGLGGDARMVEICLVALDYNLEIVDQISSLVKSPRDISPSAVRVHGIRGSDLRAAPNFEQLWPHIHPFLEKRVLVAHNARFDLGILQSEISHMGKQDLNFVSSSLCTLDLARQARHPSFRPLNFQLTTLCQELGVDLENHHQARADVLATIEVFKKLLALDPAVASRVATASVSQQNLPTWPKSTNILPRGISAVSPAISTSPEKLAPQPSSSFTFATIEQVLDRVRSNSDFCHVYVTGSPTINGIQATDDTSKSRLMSDFLLGSGLEYRRSTPGTRNPAFLWISHGAPTNTSKVNRAIEINVPVIREADAIKVVNILKGTDSH